MRPNRPRLHRAGCRLVYGVCRGRGAHEDAHPSGNEAVNNANWGKNTYARHARLLLASAFREA